MSKYKTLEEEHSKCSQALQGQIDIGNSVMVDSGVIAALKTVSCTRNVFARNLFRAVFSTDQLVGRSLTGKKCNANGKAEHLPSVETAKRDAVIGKIVARFLSPFSCSLLGVIMIIYLQATVSQHTICGLGRNTTSWPRKA